MKCGRLAVVWLTTLFYFDLISYPQVNLLKVKRALSTKFT